ncbi:MAG TPA: methyltransferase domain-containing protein [Roseiflexaceae bacterium]|nr:methyltransferase domain-containing protein [Roseiflexaceae bacterium]HMP39422.1 methyltransferase domain-containing protein [Roseiflexaceae bacterium]
MLYEYEAEVLGGLEAFAAEELYALHAEILFSGRGAIRFRYTHQPEALLQLSTVTAVYMVQEFGVPRPRALLGHQHFEQIVAAITAVRRLTAVQQFRTLRLSAAGEHSPVMRRLVADISQRTGLAAVDDDGDLLVRVRPTSDRSGWEVLVRISPRPLSTRAWRVCDRPGAPNAALAACMVQLSAPFRDDVLLNIGCGSGTLLIERLLYGSARYAIGCDIDDAALACARANLAAAGVADQVELEAWDARQMPLHDASVTTILADLPFGRLVGSHSENIHLYPALLGEAARVAAPGALMVLLSHEVRLVDQVLDDQRNQWELLECIRVRSSGMTPGIYCLRRLV